MTKRWWDNLLDMFEHHATLAMAVLGFGAAVFLSAFVFVDANAGAGCAAVVWMWLVFGGGYNLRVWLERAEREESEHEQS